MRGKISSFRYQHDMMYLQGLADGYFCFPVHDRELSREHNISAFNIHHSNFNEVKISKYK